MRLRRISLRSFRGVDACDVELLGGDERTGVVVVQGPNEIGKTSLAEALDVLWQYPHSSRHRAVRELQPVGRDVGTRVEVEVEGVGVAFTYAKTWNRDAGAELRIRSPRAEQLTGKEAHERAEALLSELVDRRLWAALRVPQGAVDQPDVSAAPALVAALSRAGGSAVVDARDLAVGELVTGERARWRTDTGRDRRVVTDAQAALTAAQEEHADAVAALAAVREDLDAIERLETEVAAARADLADARDGRRRASEDVAAAVELERRAALLEGERDQAAAASRDACRRADDRTALLAEHDSAAAALAAAVEAAAADDGDDAAAVQRAEDLRGERGRVAASRRSARTAAQSAREELERLLVRREHADLAAWLRRIDQAAERATAAAAALAGEPIDADVVVRLRNLDLQARAAAAALQTGAARVQVTTAHGVAATVTDDHATTDIGGATASYATSAGGPVVVDVPDVVTVRVDPGQGAEALRAAAQQHADALRAALDELGCADLSAVEQRADARRRAADELEAARREEQRLLGDDARDLLEARLRELASRVGERRPATQESEEPADEPPSAEQLQAARSQVTEAEAAAAAAEDRLAIAEARVEAASDELEQRRARRQERRLAVERAAATLQHLTARLEAERAAEPDEALAAAAAAATSALDRAEAAARVARADLEAADVAAIRLRSEAADAAVEALQRDLEEHTRELAVRQARVAARSDDGPASRVAVAAAKLAAATAAHDAAVASADAADLLAATFARHRDVQRRRWVAPLAEQVERLGRVLWGPELRVELDEDLRVATRTLDGVTLGFDALSHGAREQLALIVRLACAMVIGEGGAPVLVDDALGFSDPDRLRRMGAVLALAGRSCQIVLLTCHPQRYRHVPGARTIRLGDSGPAGLAA